MKPEISVVLPVYNVEQYINKCIDSILSQSFTDFELIVVDDKSTDSSGNICESYNDERMCVVRLEKNAGQSNARNVGMAKASGKYITFVDSDDCIEPDTFKKAYNEIVAHDADMVVFGFNNVVETDGKVMSVTKVCHKPCFLDNPKAIASELPSLKSNNLIDTCCNKLYRFSLIKDSGIVMPDGELYEDTEFNLRLLSKVKSMCIMDECFYNYMQRKTGSTTRSYQDNKIIFLKKRSKTLEDYFKSVDCFDGDKIGYCSYSYIRYMFSCFTDLSFPKCPYTYSEKLKLISDEIKSESYENAVKTAIPDGRLGAIIIKISATKNTRLIYSVCRMIYFIKYKMQSLFNAIKSK